MNNAQTEESLAIVIPPATDLNRGDQALLWESIELIKETGLFSGCYVLESGDSEREREVQTRQSKAKGLPILPSLLPHPRRGRHREGDRIQDGLSSLILMSLYALFDFLKGESLLLYPHGLLARLLVPAENRAALKHFQTCKAVFVKGGGFLHSYGGLTSLYYTWYQLFYIRLALRLDKPVIILPNSFGPFKGIGVGWLVRRTLARCAAVTARESLSASTISTLTGQPTPVFPDLGYFLGRVTPETGAIGLPPGKNAVGFTVRPWRFPASSQPQASYNAYVRAVAETAKHVALKGYHPVFVAQVLGPSAHEDDRLAISDVTRLLHGINYTVVIDEGDCYRLAQIYSQMKFVVGTRFHSVIFAQAQGIPCLAISYGGQKGQGIMNDLGMGDLVIPIDSVSAETLQEGFDRLEMRSEEVRQRLLDLRISFEEGRAELIRVVRGALGREE